MSELETHHCPECSIEYAAPAALFERRQQDGRSFFCPNGHSLSYRDSEHDKTRRERDRLKQEAARRDDEISRLQSEKDNAEKRATTAERKTKRVEKRAHAGLCPCCNRTFSELARHIATRHPDFRAEEVGREKVVPLIKTRA